MVFLEVSLVHFSEIVEIIGAFGIDTFMDDKVFAFLFGNECIAAVWVAHLHGRETAFAR